MWLMYVCYFGESCFGFFSTDSEENFEKNDQSGSRVVVTHAFLLHITPTAIRLTAGACREVVPLTQARIQSKQ